MNLPRVSIIVTAYLPKSKPYLDLCMRSIEQLDYPKDLLDVMIISPKSYAPTYKGLAATISPPQEVYYNSHALNEGIYWSDPECKYLLFVNDDVILTKGMLKALVRSSQHLNDQALVMPIGNDTQCGRHILALPEGMACGPFRHEQVKDRSEQLMIADSYYPMGILLADILYMYAVLVPTKALKAIGPFDTSRQGQDDVDYSYRAKQKGYMLAYALDALCFHAGGATADITMTDKSRLESLESFNEKWPEHG